MKMMSYKHILAVLALGLPFAAHADEQVIELWPNQRAQHTIKSEENAAKYAVRGSDYVAHLYSTGGEVPIEPASDFMAETKPELDVVPVNVDQVSDIVGKYTGSIIEDPAK